METKEKKEKKRRSVRKRRVILWILMIWAVMSIALGAVYLISAGHVEAAINTMHRWGEDGTLERFRVFVEEKLPPILIAAGFGIGTVLAALLPVIKKIKLASSKFDEGTRVSVKTADLAESSREEMRAFIEEMRVREDARIAAQKAMLEGFINEIRADTAAEHAKTRRIQGDVRKLVRIEMLAHGADEALVKKGVASEIAGIANLEEKGGESDEEAGGDDPEAAEAEEAPF